MASLTSGQVARLAGVHVETIRFYERKGLLPRPARRPSGIRQFPEDTVGRIRFIKRAQELGFTLREVGELLAIRLDSETPCGDVRARTEAKIRIIDEKIQDLKRIRTVLERVAATCGEHAATDECPVLEAVDVPGGPLFQEREES